MKCSYSLIAFSFLFTFSVPAGAQTAAPAAAARPRIQFENPVFDFGKVKSGEIVKHSFVFTNTGTANLEILDVKPGCGCTTAGTWEKTVEPGKTGSIPLQFNSTSFGGRVAKPATVICNDPAQSNVVLQLTGTIWKAIDLNPNTAYFNLPPEGQTNETKLLRIVSNIEEAITLSDPVCGNSAFRTELKTIRPGKEFELAIIAVGPFTNANTYAPISIKTSSKEMPEITTSAYATVLPVLSVMPQQLMLPAGPVANNSRWMVTIRNNGVNNVTLSDATINVAGATVSMQEAQPGRLYNLTVGFPVGFEVDPAKNPAVTVKSTHPKNPVITIPVMQPPNPAKKTTTAKLATPTPAH